MEDEMIFTSFCVKMINTVENCAKAAHPVQMRRKGL